VTGCHGRMPPWAVSFAAHGVMLVLLALVTVVPPRSTPPRMTINSGASLLEEEYPTDSFVELPALHESFDSDMDTGATDFAALDALLASPLIADGAAAEHFFSTTTSTTRDDLPGADDIMRTVALGTPKLDVLATSAKPDRPRWRGFQPKSPTEPKKGISAAGDAAAAATGLISTLTGHLEEGQTYVVWLLDASISLVEDRKTLADTLEPFYSEHRPAPGDRGQLLTSVVAFGATTQVVTGFSPLGNTGAIRRLPIDPSGTENVMSAVQSVVSAFQSRFQQDARRRDRLRIVIWTDESGDDTRLLEEVIALCRSTGTVVHVVGPSSVLGSDRGVQPWVDERTKWRFLLPVTRGPDTYLPERLLLPYWFDIDADAGDYDGVLSADGREWYGGPLRENLLAGIGPYALTRLALQTGGTFRLLDRPGETSRFDIETMKEYLPKYGSAAELIEEINDSPFRLAILQAVQKTYDPGNRMPPRMDFLSGFRETTYPFRVVRGQYFSPAVFRQRLFAELTEQDAKIEHVARITEEALACFSESVDWEQEYGKEASRRWQAWYDITRGRLLAMSIRFQEYRTVCRIVRRPDALAPTTNQISFRPGPQLCGDDDAIQRRRDEAVRLLQRARDRNRGTPWEMLAAWELSIPLGIGVDQFVVQPSPPAPPPPARPRITFPSL